MITNNRIIIVALVIISISRLIGTPVNVDIAEKVALNWYDHYNSDKTILASVKEVVDLKYNEENNIFAFIMDQGGFVMVAADDASLPVLGYSFTSRFEAENLNPNINYWFKKLQREIDFIKKNKISNVENIEKWKRILDKDFTLFNNRDNKNVEPLLSALWSQGAPYNNYTPLVGDESTVTGCVATAMALIMHYYQFPTHGLGNSSYNWQGLTLSADYANTVYDWAIMADNATGSSLESKHQVATISYHAGVAVEMGYGVNGSGAFGWATAMVDHFNYNQALYNIDRGNITDWLDMLHTEIDNSRPVFYVGYGAAGHAFICDGYQENDYFHFNWGWEGADNGYYTVDALNTNSGSFNNSQNCMINIFPNEEDLVLTQNIPDMLMHEESIVIDLNNYFNSISGSNITYTVDENLNPNVITTSISGNELSLIKASELGLTTIRVIAETSGERFFDSFEIKVIDQTPLVGNGNSYNFAETSFIDAGNNDMLNEMQLLSVSAWININNLDTNKGIIAKSNSTNSGWYLNINSINKLKFFIKVEDGSKRKQYSNSTLPENEWIHIAATYDGVNLSIYINGLLDKNFTYESYQAISPLVDENLTIGKMGSYYFDGEIDEVRLWNKGLSHEEVYESMGNSLIGNENGLISNWKIDENFGSYIEDLTSNNEGFINVLNNYNWNSSNAPIKYFTLGNSYVSGTLPGITGNSITYQLVDNASGQVILNSSSTGEFTATPTSNYVIFSYKIIEEDNESEIITVEIDNETVEMEEGNYELSIMNYELNQNYPNPFNPITKIRYELSMTRNAIVEILVHNAMGQQVWSSPITDHALRVTGSILFDGSKFNSGIYYYSLIIDNKIISTKSMVLIK